MKYLPAQGIRRRGRRESQIHCSLLKTLTGKHHVLSSNLQGHWGAYSPLLSCVLSSPPLGLERSSPLHGALPQWAASSSAICLQDSTSNKFLRCSCHQRSTSPRYEVSWLVQVGPSNTPSRKHRSDWLSFPASFSHVSSGSGGWYHLPGFSCPWPSLFPVISVQTDCFELDWFSLVSLGTKCLHIWQVSQWGLCGL